MDWARHFVEGFVAIKKLLTSQDRREYKIFDRVPDTR